jgi:nicotinate-nucleotide pyrophosphorylase (carboxylating)
MKLDSPQISALIHLAISEDIGPGDITTNSIVKTNQRSQAVIRVKQDGIIAGLEIAKLVVENFDKNAKWDFAKSDGNYCINGDAVAKIEAEKRALLSSERIVLNFLQRISGIATKTNLFIKQLEGLNTKILDTRKTVPGHRILDKYGIAVGGGTNHRMGLFDMVMIKDNHIKIAGGIKNAVDLVKKERNKSIKIEVEASSIEQVIEALNSDIDIIMLDNMDIKEMKEAVKICKGKVLTEASGNVSLENIRTIAETGVDYISVGALTHSVQALDISMKVI